ncbi:MAG: hypothetical protein K2J82_00155 [Muribaculaceae bacterium]|nr:hypothetical protein [Muribaculaceae bacterium]
MYICHISFCAFDYGIANSTFGTCINSFFHNVIDCNQKIADVLRRTASRFGDTCISGTVDANYTMVQGSWEF